MTTGNTGNGVLNAMLSGATWAQNPGTPVNVTYSFMTSAPTSGEPVVGFRPLSAADQAIVSSALPAFSADANITFTLVPDDANADIMFGLDNQTDSDGLTYDFYGSSYDVLTGSHVYFSDNDPYSGDVTNFWLTLHELGNATGLQDFSGFPISEDVALGLPASDATFDYTVMANNDPPHADPPATGPFTSTPALLDVEALQYLYGANETGFTAGARSTTSGLVYSFTDNSAPECIWVGNAVAGQTTFDFSACDGTTTINLNAGTFSSTADVGTPYNNVSIAYGAVIKTAIAGNGGSTIIGNNAGDTLVGGTGSDTFYVDGGTFAPGTGGNTTIISGGGQNTVVFHDPRADYTITTGPDDQTLVTETGGKNGDGVTTTTGTATFQFGNAYTAPPVSISGTVMGQATTNQQTITPFSNVTIEDANSGQTETVTVTLSAAANGTLSNLGGGDFNAMTGIYTDTGSAAAVTTALDGLVFTPAAGGTLGQAVTTVFTINDSDTASGSTTDSTTSVVATNDEVVLNGPQADYEVADDNGSLYIQATGAAGAGIQILPGVSEMVFTDGMGVFDPTGAAEDVARLYQAALDRVPDVNGIDYWAADINASTLSLTTVANDFAASPEFIQDYGTLTDAAFVNQLYENVLRRPADASGATYWDGVLTSGATRGAVLVGFAESQENEANTISTAGDPTNAEVYRLYEATLGRAPDPSGQAYWVSALATGTPPSQVAQDLVSSSEFQQDYGTLSPSDFVSTLYENVLHRAADPAGLQYWTNTLQQGTSQSSVVLSFADSAENRAQTAGATHANWVFIPT